MWKQNHGARIHVAEQNAGIVRCERCEKTTRTGLEHVKKNAPKMDMVIYKNVSIISLGWATQIYTQATNSLHMVRTKTPQP